ncbi:MAG: hypothetical protein KBC64_01885 [Simkaniaceae bacterium]|nr:hypothetical protein [Simkaniaceae bacterium]
MRFLMLLLFLFPLAPLKGDELPILVASYDLNDTHHFYQLSLSKSAADKIYKLIHNMGTLSWPKLLWKKKEMEKLGEQVDHVHPLRFLGVIMSNDHLKECMRNVADSPLKMNRFMNGLSDKLDKNFKNHNLLPHVAGFAETVNKDPYRIEDLIIKKKWRALVDYLME